MTGSDTTNQWKIGFPPGDYYEGMTDDFEVAFTVGGIVWHRRKVRVASVPLPAAPVDVEGTVEA
jgi:hypothetical protein